MTESEKRYDLIIVGAGVFGAFHAFHAVNMGLRVLVLEKNAQPRGASTRNFGQVVPSGMDATWQRYGRESLRIYKSLQEQVDLSVRNLGSIYIASDDEEMTLIEELRQINQSNDYPSELWTKQQCLDRYPQLRADYCRGGLFFPEEVSVNPRVMIHRLWKYISQQPGIDIHFQTSVTQLQTTDSGHQVDAVTADGQRFHGDRALICCGADVQLLYPELLHNSDLEIVKLQMLRLAPQTDVQIPGNVLTGLSIRRYESFAECPSWNQIKAREPADVFWKKWGVHILFKQEADGGIILGDSHEYTPAAEADAHSFELRADISSYFIREGSKIFDLPSWDVESSWYGLYCQTRDPSGILNRVIDDRIHIVTGIGGKGMTSSAGFAKHNLQQIYQQVGAN